MKYDFPSIWQGPEKHQIHGLSYVNLLHSLPLLCHAGQSQWSSLVLVAPRCASTGKQSPAHHPRHDLPQRPSHRHPQSSHLRHTEEAAMISPALRRMEFSDLILLVDSSDSLFHSYVSSLVH